MRVLLVGREADRARLRAQLRNGDVQIAGEFATLESARRSRIPADAIVLVPNEDANHSRDLTPDDEGAEIVEPLTAREREVLELLAHGLPNKAIATRLHISDQTVKFHVSSIAGKLGASNRTDVVRRAIRRGLITL